MDGEQSAAESIRKALARAGQNLVERESLIELIGLAAVAQEHLLIVGPPGTAKSQAARRVAQVLGAEFFEYLLGRFTEPGEIFGPVDLAGLREGVVRTETTGMLPEAEFAFLDEVFRGSTAILNTLLGILNERHFQRGHTRMKCPLRACVGASNDLPDDPSLEAFADRFLLRMFVQPTPGPHLDALLQAGWALEEGVLEPLSNVQSLDELGKLARGMKLDQVRPHLAHAVRLLRKEGIDLSDRRAVKLQKLVAAAAALAGRTEASQADLWPIIYAIPTEAEQQRGRDILRPLLEASENRSLPAAAAEASLGPLARAARLLTEARKTLEQRPVGQPQRMSAWRLQLEALARELDSGFTPEQLPEELRDLRSQLVRELESD